MDPSLILRHQMSLGLVFGQVFWIAYMMHSYVDVVLVLKLHPRKGLKCTDGQSVLRFRNATILGTLAPTLLL